MDVDTAIRFGGALLMVALAISILGSGAGRRLLRGGNWLPYLAGWLAILLGLALAYRLGWLQLS